MIVPSGDIATTLVPTVAPANGDDAEPLGGIDCLDQLTDLWVFGYGSLLWNTGFTYSTMEVGYIEGYSRKFWQGNTTHRGTPDSVT